MKPKIFCANTRKGIDTFYLVTASGVFFLFEQSYKSGVHAHFSKGIVLDEIFDFSKTKRNRAVIKTQSKLPAYIKYVESEFNVVVLEQTLRRAQRLRLTG